MLVSKWDIILDSALLELFRVGFDLVEAQNIRVLLVEELLESVFCQDSIDSVYIPRPD